MKRLLLALGLCLWASYCYAQTAAVTIPKEVNGSNNNASGTITTPNVFQDIWVVPPNATIVNRTGCTITNNGTHNMYVYFGKKANATTSNSNIIVPGQSVYCQAGVVVLQDEVSIADTVSGEAFYANQY